jgi:hypothetical protein
VENNGTWLEWTMLKPGGTVTYKSREYVKERGGHLMNRIIAQMNFGKKIERGKRRRRRKGEKAGLAQR